MRLSNAKSRAIKCQPKIGYALPPYYHQIWHYQVRQWRRDGEHEYLAIITNGCTDNIDTAFQLMNAETRSTHVYDCHSGEVIMRNY